MKVLKIGRSPENNVVMDDIRVSAFHLELYQNETNETILKDLKSTNGTYVNDKKIEGEIRLLKGDIVKIGKTVIDWEKLFQTTEKSSLTNTMPDAKKIEEEIETTEIQGIEKPKEEVEKVKTQAKPASSLKFLRFGLIFIGSSFIVFLTIWYFMNVVRP